MTQLLKKKIRELDFFSLLVFKCIFDTGQANIAAKMLAVSASKISRSLSLLRIAFDDDLFYRRQQGLKPTLLAENLYQPVYQLINSVTSLEQVVTEKASQDQLPILQLAVEPMLMRSLSLKLADKAIQQTLGPVRLHVWNDNSLDMIHRGELDFGIAFEACDFNELTSEKVYYNGSVCLVAKETHSIWQSYPDIRLEDICNYSFIYLVAKGFNDKIDPLEQFAREQDLSTSRMEKMVNYEEWLAHLQTLNSIAFASSSEMALLDSMLGFRCELLPQQDIVRLFDSIKQPKAYLVERTQAHRRYHNDIRQELLTLLNKWFN
ncbi:LysR family transcriptional regulator [Shewanella sp. SG41-4]|uniref:LysR family transcriptional regulator n=1 Tax=Shewanella sp. SG41-4 TaxID=2760976 RepID=UPI001601219E|nr:LysR family transcriptional regulator [Shewanella sp. SG41-4]MBB1437680.1 LysR family transcriptional regulator [Shewanella sp. SG41-4]